MHANPGIENPFEQMVGLQTDQEVLHDGQVRRFHLRRMTRLISPGHPSHGGFVDQLLGLHHWLDVAARSSFRESFHPMSRLNRCNVM